MEVNRAFVCLGLAVVVAFPVSAFGGSSAVTKTDPDSIGDAGGLDVRGLVDHAVDATRAQALRAGWTLDVGASVASHDVPMASEAFLEVFERVGVEPDERHRERLEALDRLAQDRRRALALVADAFLELHAADARARAGPPADDPGTAGVLEARVALLERVADLQTAFAADESDAPVAESIRAPPVLALDLRAGDACIGAQPNVTDDVYTRDYVLSIDTCGADVYRNNAGGTVRLLEEDPGTALVDCVPGNETVASTGRPVAAAAIDLTPSEVNNVFGHPDRGCGVNGGGHNGTGFLFAATLGHNRFVANHTGVNGGAANGTGFLAADGFRHSTYQATGRGANGGGYSEGLGALVSDTPLSEFTVHDPSGRSLDGLAANGGGADAGAGLLRHNWGPSFRSNETWTCGPASNCWMTPTNEDGLGYRGLLVAT